MRGAPLVLPSTATAQFQAVVHTGGALMCVLPVGGAWVIHLVVLYGYQGAGRGAEQFGLADLILDAAVCELAVVVSLQSLLVISEKKQPKSFFAERDLGWAPG